LKRSNRLVLLIGIFLALVAFVLIVLMFSNNNPNSPTASQPPTTVQLVVAAQDVNLGATFTEADLTLKEFAVAERPPTAFVDTSLVVGQIARQEVTAGELITAATLGADNGVLTEVNVPPGFVAMSIRVTQNSGVGTVVKPGDFIDLVTGFSVTQLVTPDLENEDAYVTYPGDQLNPTTVKAIAQGIQVLATLLPPPPTDANGQPVPAANNVVVLNDREQILILSVTTQTAELIKFAQTSGDISVVLRSSDDCTAEAPSPEPSASAEPSISTTPVEFCPTVATTGITLRRVIDDYGVIPPTVVQVLQPTPLPGTGQGGGNNP
jgi:Flp pilus assembly protein CpaB